MKTFSLRRWLRPVFSARRPGRKAPRGLRVEQLEDRCVPSTLQAISVPQGSQPPSDTAAGPSYLPAVSADGRFVAFESAATNLVPGQAGGAGPNVFLLDRNAGSVALVSHLPGGPATGTTLFFPTPKPLLLSRDGRYVVYVTGADVIQGPSPFNTASTSVVVYDRTTGGNTLVSHTSASPTAPTFFSANLDAISPNGRYIAFDTLDTDLVPGEVRGAGAGNLYLYDQTTQTTFLVTHVAGQNNVTEGFTGAPFGGPSVSVSDNGTVAFLDSDTGGQLVGGQTGSFNDNIYLYDVTSQTNQLVSAANSDFTHGTGQCGAPVVSEDGSTVVFTSRANNLVPGQNTAGFPSVNVYRFNAGSMTLVSGSGGSATTGADDDSGTIDFTTPALAVTPDGRFVAFVSQATDLVAGQGGAAGNVFLYDAQGPSLRLLSGAGGSATVGAGGDATLQPPDSSGFAADPISGANSARVLSLSDDGSKVAFISQAKNLVPGQTGAAGDNNIYLWTRAGGRASLVTGRGGSATATDFGQSGFPTLSGDGSQLAFETLDFDLSAGFVDANGVADVFVYNTAAPALSLASRAAFRQTAPGNSYPASVSADGSFTVFASTAENLVPNQNTNNPNQNVFLFHQPAAGGPATLALVNHLPGLANSTGDGGIPFTFGQRPPDTELPALSAGGSTVAFVSADDNLITGSPTGGDQFFETNVYLYNTQTTAVTLVNHEPGKPATPNLVAQAPAVSASGRYVAYVLGFSANPGPSGVGQGGIALYDSQTDTTTTITALDGMDRGTASDPTISDDGRFVSYLDGGQVFVFDRVTGKTVLASHDNSSSTSTTSANGDSSAPVISHDGSAVAFVSAATNLVPGQVASSFTNVFLYRNDTSGADAVGPVRLVSGAGGSATVGGNGSSDSPAIDNDGSHVAYRSDATNLVGGQTGAPGNVFEFNTQTGAQTLVSHQAGAGNAATGGASEPVIDDDGHLVSYASTAANLIPGQSAPSGLQGINNVFVWLRQTNANILASGQNGSPTVTGNANSDFPLLTRDSFPVFSSVATNLVNGVGGTSVAYLNTLVSVSLAPNTVAVGSPAGSMVGGLSVSSLLAGQFLPPVYSLPAGEANNGLFGLSGAALVTEFAAAAAAGYQVRLHVNVGFGDSPVLLNVFAAVPAPGGGFIGGPPVAAHPLLAELVSVRVGHSKTKRLMVEVFDLLTGAEVEAFASPFQAPAYRAITLTPLGNGLALLSARKGKRTVMALLLV